MLCKREDLQNRQCIKYLFSRLYINVYHTLYVFVCYPSYVFLFFYHLILLLIVLGCWSSNLVFLHFSLHCEFEVMFSF